MDGASSISPRDLFDWLGTASPPLPTAPPSVSANLPTSNSKSSLFLIALPPETTIRASVTSGLSERP